MKLLNTQSEMIIKVMLITVFIITLCAFIHIEINSKYYPKPTTQITINKDSLQLFVYTVWAHGYRRGSDNANYSRDSGIYFSRERWATDSVSIRAMLSKLE
jgi:hypothetical protein